MLARLPFSDSTISPNSGDAEGLSGTSPQVSPSPNRATRQARHSGTVRAFDLQEQPTPCQTPVPRHGLHRDLEHGGCIFHAQSAEISQFHNSRLSGIPLLQFFIGHV